MNVFEIQRPSTVAEAVGLAQQADSLPIAGGTELFNWMKDGVVQPRQLVDLSGIAGLSYVEDHGETVRIGAMTRMSEVAQDPLIAANFPVVREALLKSASQQIRNMGTAGGNILQRTRCPYFRANVQNCNKLKPGTGCGALEGRHRQAAIFGQSDACIATHPSDLAVALAALDATVHVSGPSGSRAIGFGDFHLLPGTTPHLETVLAPGDLITMIELPKSGAARRSAYLKIRERASYEFALVSAAVALDLEGDRIRGIRIALGGVAPKPWRLGAVEKALAGAGVRSGAVKDAVNGGFGEAKAGTENGFKIEIAKRAVIRTIELAGRA
jgi:xanthine dehydrogenase YagS FAD-binding subunit